MRKFLRRLAALFREREETPRETLAALDLAMTLEAYRLEDLRKQRGKGAWLDAE